jgi:hypothetical protein
MIAGTVQGTRLIRATVFSAAVVFCASSASAMTVLSQANSIARPEIATEVKIICEQDGFCHQRGRRPVAHWVYGEGNFDRPYVGPGYYGRPGHRWIWWPFFIY